MAIFVSLNLTQNIISQFIFLVRILKCLSWMWAHGPASSFLKRLALPTAQEKPKEGEQRLYQSEGSEPLEELMGTM